MLNPLNLYVKSRVIDQNKNFLIVFVGPTGSGKSYAALKFLEDNDLTFNINRVSFKAIDFMKQVNECIKDNQDTRGIGFLWDEFGVEHNARAFMSLTNRMINFFFQTSRHRNFIMAMTVPYLSYIDSATRLLLHAIAQTERINHKEKTSTLKILFQQVAPLSGKAYHKHLRFSKDSKQYKCEKLKFSMPSEPLRNKYEDLRAKWTQGLNDNIYAELIGLENKQKGKIASLTERQKEIMLYLANHTVDEASEHFNIDKRNIYATKAQMEKKGVRFEPIREKNKIIRYNVRNIEDFR